MDLQEWRKNNPDTVKLWVNKNHAKVRSYYRKCMNSDPMRKIAHSVRRRMWGLIKGCKETRRIDRYCITGCDGEFLRKYLEGLWSDGMNWSNYGKYGWHVDHIIPCSSFDMSSMEEIKKCFHYSNLQPLWWRDNLTKKDKMPVDICGASVD